MYRPRPPALPRKCAFCGREFTPCRRGVECCSPECRKRLWTAQRGRKRAAARSRREHVATCECCGKPIAWSPLVSNKRFCSQECKRRHEAAVRRFSRCRADAVRVKPASSLPASLDVLRGTRSDEYFDALFRLPDAEQWAEMETWGAEDHEAAAEYLRVCGRDDLVGGDPDGARQEDICVPDEPPPAFDEEDHFGH